MTIMSKKSEPKEKDLNIKERHLGRNQAYGMYYTATNKIEIDPRLKAREYLYVLIHELTHMALPEANEEGVTRISELVSKGVWQQGFRRIKE